MSDTTADQRTDCTIEERCGVCGEYIWWDDTPNPVCDACAAKPNVLADALARVAALEAALQTMRAAFEESSTDTERALRTRVARLEHALRSIPIHDDDTELEALRTAALRVTRDSPGGTR